MNKNNLNGVSVVICCYNSSAVILPTLQALKTQVLPENAGYEVILVDNRCTDDTVDKVLSFWKSDTVELKLISEDLPGITNARRKGVETASFDIIVFVDDDNILSFDYLSKVITNFNKMPGVGIVGGYSQPLIQNSSLPKWFLKYQGVYACGPQNEHDGILEGKRKRLYGAGFSIRTDIAKNIFNINSKFILTGNTGNKSLRGEDTEICYKTLLLGYELFYDSSLTLSHNLQPDRLNWKKLCYYRTNGGMTSPIFWIYEDIIERKTPLSMFLLIKIVAHKWLKFLKNPSNLLLIYKDGARASFNFHTLIGLSLFIYKFHNQYNLFVKQIQESAEIIREIKKT